MTDSGTLPYDPVEGTPFTGEVQFDDARVAAIAPGSLRAGTTACRMPVLGRVRRAVDGDTIHVTENGSGADLTVRMIGVDTPEIAHMPGETSECFGDQATVFTNSLVGHQVWLTFDAECEDTFGRQLAYVHIGAGRNDMWQRQLLRRGYARVLTISPNDSFSGLFEMDLTTAQVEGAGQWTACR